MTGRENLGVGAISTNSTSFVPCPPCNFIVDPVSKKAAFPLRFHSNRASNPAVSDNTNHVANEQDSIEFQRIGAHRARKPNYQRYPKPPYSYTGMIATAILNSPDKRLTLSAIQRSIENMFPFFRGEYKGWRDSVRHNLSHCDCFIKINKDNSRMNGKFNFWSVDPTKLPTDVFRRKSTDKDSKYAEYLHQELGLQEIELPPMSTTIRPKLESNVDDGKEPPAKRFKADRMNNAASVSLPSVTYQPPTHNLYSEVDNLIGQSLSDASSRRSAPGFDYELIRPELEKTFNSFRYANYDYPALNTSLVLNDLEMSCSSNVHVISPAQIICSRARRYSLPSTPVKREDQQSLPDSSTRCLLLSPISPVQSGSSTEPGSDIDVVNPPALSMSNIFDL